MPSNLKPDISSSELRMNGSTVTFKNLNLLSVLKAWVGEMPHAPSISMEMVAHGTM